jgi:hypothetical protein
MVEDGEIQVEAERAGVVELIVAEPEFAVGPLPR